MRTWVLACVAVLGASAATAAEVAPPPRAVDDLWLPTPKPRGEGALVAEAPASAFPRLVFVPPAWRRGSPGDYEDHFDAAIRAAWPRLLGEAPVKVAPTDGPREKLLKARLRQSLLNYHAHATARVIIGPAPSTAEPLKHLADIGRTVQELRPGPQAEVAAWLGEVVAALKYEERFTRLRLEAGALRRYELQYVTQHRLRAEADLWKVLHPVAPAAVVQPEKKDGAKEKPPGGDWLSDKTLPPTLFPDLVPPSRPSGGWNFLDDIRYQLRLAAACPRLSENPGLTIEPHDDTLRRLLKARVHQGALELAQGRTSDRYHWDAVARHDCVDDLLAATAELWGPGAKERLPWLEELLIDAKEWERWAALRAEAGAIRPASLRAATRSRLKVEAELWKAKNPK